MAYKATVALDSISESGHRLTTMELTYPRFVHSEFMTHRMFSRNAASSRAIPVEKTLVQVVADPAMPVYWGRNQKGMQAAAELDATSLDQVKLHWLLARDEAVLRAKSLLEWGLHKQVVNRILEPWGWITVIVTATEWANFFWLRCHQDAQPEIRTIAVMALREYHQSVPELKSDGEWHCPFIQPDERQLWSESHAGIEHMKKVSVARCARISYLTHEGTRDVNKDRELFERLKGGSGGVGHWSPFEHVATPARPDSPVRASNFIGWEQYRKQFSQEHHSEMSAADRERLLAQMEAMEVPAGA